MEANGRDNGQSEGYNVCICEDSQAACGRAELVV